MKKFFEIRDRMTFIPVVAIKISTDDAKTLAEQYLFNYSGYTTIIVCRLDRQQPATNADAWVSRTMIEAHQYIEDNFDKLNSGDVVDVEYILGETTSPKESQRP